MTGDSFETQAAVALVVIDRCRADQSCVKRAKLGRAKVRELAIDVSGPREIERSRCA